VKQEDPRNQDVYQAAREPEPNEINVLFQAAIVIEDKSDNENLCLPLENDGHDESSCDILEHGNQDNREDWEGLEEDDSDDDSMPPLEQLRCQREKRKSGNRGTR
jgi:hypothetical protein